MFLGVLSSPVLTCLHCIPFYSLFSISGSSGKPNDRSCLLCGVLLQLPCFFSRLVKGRRYLFLTTLRGFEDSIHFILIIRFATHFSFSLPKTNKTTENFLAALTTTTTFLPSSTLFFFLFFVVLY